MKLKLFFIFLFILALSGCITHVFVDGEVRLQIKNESDVSIFDMSALDKVFSLDKRKVHVVILKSIAVNGSYTLLFIFCFYDGGFKMIELAKGLNSEVEEVVFVVHYVDNKIERLSMVDYLRSLQIMLNP